MPLTAVEKIWIDGELVDWDKAQVHVLTHSLHYGSGVFEGIRAYPTPAGVAVFRLTEHIQRLFMSAKILMIDVPFTPAQLVEATKELVRVNALDDGCYIRPIVYLGYGEMGLNPLPCPVSVAIGGQNAVIKYVGGSPGTVAGVMQINAVVPAGLPNGNASLIVQVGSAASQGGVTITVSGN